MVVVFSKLVNARISPFGTDGTAANLGSETVRVRTGSPDASEFVVLVFGSGVSTGGASVGVGSTGTGA
jgi:hypothetical protein